MASDQKAANIVEYLEYNPSTRHLDYAKHHYLLSKVEMAVHTLVRRIWDQEEYGYNAILFGETLVLMLLVVPHVLSTGNLG